jgi:hypothetical protein
VRDHQISWSFASGIVINSMRPNHGSNHGLVKTPDALTRTVLSSAWRLNSIRLEPQFWEFHIRIPVDTSWWFAGTSSVANSTKNAYYNSNLDNLLFCCIRFCIWILWADNQIVYKNGCHLTMLALARIFCIMCSCATRNIAIQQLFRIWTCGFGILIYLIAAWSLISSTV